MQALNHDMINKVNMNYIGTTYIRASELFKSDLHLGSLIQVHPETQKCMRHAMIPKNILTPNLGLLPQIIYRYALGSTLLELKLEVKDLETVGDSPGPKMYLHTIYGTATINYIGDLLWVHFFKN